MSETKYQRGKQVTEGNALQHSKQTDFFNPISETPVIKNAD
jgi:hypothetical protein